MAKELRNLLDNLVGRFSNELMNVFGKAVLGSLDAGPAHPKAPKSAKPRGGKGRKLAPVTPATPATKKNKRGPKSTRAEVKALGEQILTLLAKATSPMKAKDLQVAAHVERGAFNYALNKLKAAKTVVQHGERRLAKYSLAKTAAVKAPEKAAGIATPRAAKKPARAVRPAKGSPVKKAREVLAPAKV